MPGVPSAILAGIGAVAAGIVSPPLQPVSPAILAAANIHGTSCVWRRTARGPLLLALSDDHAVVRIGDRTIILSPASGAHDLFPFTFDRWQAGDITIAIKIEQALAREDEERLTGRAVVTIKRDNVSQRLTGVVSCGT